MATIEVQPRDTPGERAGTAVEVELDEALSVLANQLEEWVVPLEHWELQLREGHEFDRANNVEARLGILGRPHLAANGLDVELFHIAGPPLGGTRDLGLPLDPVEPF